MRHTRRPPRVPGYRLGDPLGFGSGGPVWAAHSPDGQLVAVRVVRLDASLVPSYRRRLLGLRGVVHPHLAGVTDVVALDDLTTAVVGPAVPGPTLAAVRAARAPLGEAEVGTLLGQLAGALAALHEAGVVHGDVSPSNVVATPEGWVLVDVAGFAPGEGGTVGFVAPEREAGAAASAAADVWSLGAVAAFSGARVPEAAHAALAADPAARPAAALLARSGPSVGPRLPPGDALAQASLRAAALAAPTTRLGGRVRRRRPDRSRDDGASPRRRPRRDPGRHRGPRTRSLRLPGGRLPGALAVLVAAVVVGLTAAAFLAHRPGEPKAAAVPPPAVADVVRGLLTARDAALTGTSLAALHAVSAAGSPAREQDDELWDRMRAAGVRLEGLHTAVLGVDVIGADDVVVRLRQEAHARVSETGSTAVAAQPERCVRLRLTGDGVDAVIADVAACPG